MIVPTRHAEQIEALDRPEPHSDAATRASFYGGLAATAILLISVSFNAMLAVINGRVIALSPAAVIAAEVVLVACAFVLATLRYHARMAPWFLLAGLLTLFALVRGLLTGEPDLKYLRDVLLIPTFVVVGMTLGQRWLIGAVIALHLLVFAVFVLELAAPDAYQDLFRIQDYYINTRGNRLDEFYNTDSELFISATRPDERFFSFIDLPRLSSIFLEPVTLGNYCSIMVAFVCALFRRIGWMTALALLLSTAMMLVGCDGRLAVVTSILLLALAPIAPRLPKRSAILYLPAAAVFVIGIVSIAGWQAGADNFSGRLAHTVELLQLFNAAEWLGISDTFVGPAMDSGLAYLLTTQSIIGLALLWAWIAWVGREDTIAQVRFTHAACLYLTLTMLVSYSFLTIKTAALLWSIHGALQGGFAARSAGPATPTSLRTRRTLT